MKIFSSLIATSILALAEADYTVTTTQRLRGKPVTRTRHVHTHQTNERLRQNRNSHPEPLVDPHAHHHTARLKGTDSSGRVREVTIDLNQLEDKLPHDADIFKRTNHQFHNEQPHTNMRHASGHQDHPKKSHGHTATHHLGHRTDGHIGHHDINEHHFEAHNGVEEHYHNQVHLELSKQKEHEIKTEPQKTKTTKKKKRQNKSLYALPTGLAEHFNDTLFEKLHEAPFEIYEEALGHHHEIREGASFPVFAVPQWHNMTGVFSGFSKRADPLIFENAQFLLHWHDIVAPSSGVSEELQEFMENNNFHSSLIIGKSFMDSLQTNFLGLVVSYYQHGSAKNVMVPFAKLEDFFDDTSEKHLLDPDTKSLEVQALHDMIEERSGTNSTFYHPALELSVERMEQIEDLEIIHFQKLFQLLIRRSFLFSFGYADCLMTESDELRACLDDTFYSVVKMETSVRGALDDQIVERMAEINGSFHSNIREACISVQGSGTGMMYGTGGCANKRDLGSFVTTYASY